MGGPKHPKVGSQNALLQGRSLWKTLLEHTVQDQIETALLIIWSFSISIAVRLQKITGNAEPRVYYY